MYLLIDIINAVLALCEEGVSSEKLGYIILGRRRSEKLFENYISGSRTIANTDNSAVLSLSP